MKPIVQRLLGLAAGAALICVSTDALAADITGAGATFPALIYQKWAEAYKAKAGVGLNYQAIGSGGGIAQIKAKTVDFGASDKPLSPGELESAGLTQFPTVIGAVVPVVNIPGIKAGELTLDGKTLAEICLGKIAFWDDAAIKHFNPSVALPHLAIATVHRADGSGTNFIFTNYLSKMSPDWSSNVGAATSVEWPSGIGAKGNEGVANMVKQTGGSLGYVEFAYAKTNNIAWVHMINKDGVSASPSTEAVMAASGKTDWAHSDHFYVVLTNQAGHDAWPISGATFILVYKHPSDPAKLKEVLKFFSWDYENGAQMAKDLTYVPLPANTVEAIKKSWHDNIDAAAVP